MKKIPWKRLYEQFGSSKAETAGEHAVMTFRVAALKELEKLRVAWPELDCDLIRGSLIIKPSLSRIPKLNSAEP